MGRIEYEMIRGPEQKLRCKEGGNKLYCDCGCQSPHVDDSEINLEGVIVAGKAKTGYAEYKLVKDGEVVGYYNTQWSALTLNGREYLGCDREGLAPLNDQIFNPDGVSRFKTDPTTIISAGDTLEETGANEATAEKWETEDRDEQYKHHSGYCNKCHDFCYGECSV